MRQQMSAHPPPLPPYVPRAIALVLGRLLAKRRALRYASAGDALAALEAVQAGLPGDRTPRVAVLGPPPDRRGYARDADPALDRVGAALDRVLAQHTPLAMEALRDGIHETPAAPEWTLDPNLDELELDDRDGDGHR
jgi:enoyl-CoA hydratase/carnithine racemase